MIRFIAILWIFVIGGCTVQSEIEKVALRVEPEAGPEFSTTGTASWYGAELAGNPTASGEPFDPDALTAAHKELPFGTRVIVTNLANGQSVEVTINDRGPYAKGRIIDLSRAAAAKLGFIDNGTADVRLEADIDLGA